MQQSFVCPQCRTLHDEPADAAFTLVVLCLECELVAGYHQELETVYLVAAAA